MRSPCRFRTPHSTWWSQHAATNIQDRARLYGELRRVVRPGGKLALYDILAGPGGKPHFPVPWASRPELSHLLTSEAMRQHLEQAGLEVLVWRDMTEAGIAWVQARRAIPPGQEQLSLGRQLAFGDRWPEMARNLGRNLEERRIGAVQAVLMRSA